jgi:hypothetical protein
VGVQLLVGSAAEQDAPDCFAIPCAIRAAITSSFPAAAQPPCSKRSRVSSSGRPGACITPSTVTWLITITLLVGLSSIEIERAVSAT